MSVGVNGSPTKEQQQHAMYATLASQTLLKRMGSAFWEAFSGSPGASPSSSSTSRGWDVEKVRRVLEGKAVVRVVDVDGASAGVNMAREGVNAVKEGAGAGASGTWARCDHSKYMADILEGMSGLGLGGKKGV
jgi:hypothetical protein